ncbi:MAG: molybdopterin molybdotransferase MoeA [Gammaproteobacteria bacterium]|nr:molybdopterin molybdotransferase MoeA [Gammaproteobacteria bacterium]MDH4253093.1 molybdopterin molybdotransferase MoeA [Gammaproteobacteria bacterium]MDH5308919.1 molybdopterin molybdotransferase MoeA [Gammaproteobacteria bacterium]
MLTTIEAIGRIAAEMPRFDAVAVPLDHARRRVLRQRVTAERDQPPFDRVMMDGIALAHRAFAGGQRSFRVEGSQHAGDPRQTLLESDACIEVMTGAALPAGTDCVIPVERLAHANGFVEIEAGYEADLGQNIHPQGSDHKAGMEVLGPGIVISPMDIAIIASCGLDRVEVGRQPSVHIISTGNELVPPGQPIEPQQIRMSNGPALLAMLEGQGYTGCEHDHLVDDEALLNDRIAAHLDAADVLVLSGGVSMGKADYVPTVLAGLGVRTIFHKISQRPGKPMWFGIGPAGQAVFALPGNPVSTLVCCRHYVLPALYLASGRPPRAPEHAILAEPVTFRPALTCFLPVRLATAADGRLRARPVPTNTSGDFTSLGGTDGYVELALEQSEFPAGSAVPLHRWDAP